MEASKSEPSKQASADNERENLADGSSDCTTEYSLSSPYVSYVTKPNEHPKHRPSSPRLDDAESDSSLSSPTSTDCSTSTSRKSHISSSPVLSLDVEQPPFSTLQSPLMKSLVSPTADRFAPDSQRPALFDDHVASSYVPGSLHLAPDGTIERLVERLGAIPLIRQLAGDLAHRDRELVIFRLKAEERERTLKKMLVEVEVSNADIEKRLASCLNKHSDGAFDRNGEEESYTDSINDMMQQALDEDDAFSMVDSASVSNYDGDGGDGSNIVTPKATIRVYGKAIQTDTESIKSTSSQNSSKLRGWKEYFWAPKPDVASSHGKRDRAGSVSSIASRRKSSYHDQYTSANRALSPRSASRSSVFSSGCEDLEQGLGITTTKLFPSNLTSHDNSNGTECYRYRQSPNKPLAMAAELSLESSSTTSGHKKASDKAASLALKLVADTRALNGYATPSTSTSPVNTRALKPRQGSKIAMEQSSTFESRPNGVKDDLQRIIARNTTLHNSPQRQRTSSLSSMHNARAGNVRPPTITKDRAPVTLPAAQGSTSPDASLGPVEMDTIVPHAVQPPTLLQSWNEHYPADYLTDRFGFIYDKRRRSDALNNVNSTDARGTKTPESKTVCETVRKVGEEEIQCVAHEVSTTSDGLPYGTHGQARSSKSPQRQPASILERMTRPSASVLISDRGKVLSEVPLALRTRSGVSTAEESTVRLLLSQLSDMHDSLQRDRSIKWNEFLKKVRAERRRGEVEEHGMPEVLMADGELIGVSTLGNSGKGGKQKWKEFRRLVLGGIPVSYRWKVWAECSGAGALRVPGYYDELLQAHNDDPHIISQISMDINRTLTDNIFFRQGPGVHKLKQVLIAYSRRNSEVGYCQGMNMIAASLLLIMPTEEDTFWVLVSIVENILPKTYFEQSLLASRADQIVLKEYVREVLPHLDAHLQKLGVELEALTFQWFLSIFTDCLAGEALFRVWDVLLCIDGSTFLFQTALALLRLNEKALLDCDTAAAVYLYLNSNMTHQGISIDGLIQASDSLKSQVKREDVEIRRELAIKKELALTTYEGPSSYSGSLKQSDNSGRVIEGSDTGMEASPSSNTGDVVTRSCKTSEDNEHEEAGKFTPSPPLAPWI